MITLEINFGTTKEILDWYDDINKFPKTIQHDGENWDWLAYEEDPNHVVDYVIWMTKVPSWKLSYGDKAPTIFSLKSRLPSKKSGCVCGAIHDRHFPDDHMFFCPEWRPFSK